MTMRDVSSGFVSRVLAVIGLVALSLLAIYVMVRLIDVLLLIFAAILAAVAITGLRCIVQHHSPLAAGWSLVVTYVFIVLLMLASVAVIGPQLAVQIPTFIEQVPDAFEQVVTLADRLPWIRDAIEGAEDEDGNSLIPEGLPAQLFGLFSTTLGAIFSFSLIILIAFYLTLSPTSYVHNVLKVIPQAHRKRIEEVMLAQSHGLRYWLLGRLASMVFVGVFAAVGLMLLGVPMALTLGLIAGLATFIPYLGPILGAIPALMVALLEGPMMMVYVAILYFVVETAESSLVYPLAQQKAVHIAPAYTVIIQLAGGVLAGVPGVILATPLAVAIGIAIQMLYIEDVLDDEVEVLGT